MKFLWKFQVVRTVVIANGQQVAANTSAECLNQKEGSPRESHDNETWTNETWTLTAKEMKVNAFLLLYI